MKWLKKEGDKVSPGEVLFEIETVGSLYHLLKSKSWLKFWVMFLVHYGKLTIFLTYIWYSKDKATFELECMEECYLAKIIHGNGSIKVKVGEVLSLLCNSCNLSAYLLSFLCLLVYVCVCGFQNESMVS